VEKIFREAVNKAIPAINNLIIKNK
jgi:hypothetical protein